MKNSLIQGIKGTTSYKVSVNRTVPYLLPETAEFTAMPEILATGYMTGLLEWACMRAIADYLDPEEMTLGIHVDFSHEAPTVPGDTITMHVEVIEVHGKIITFAVHACDTQHETISRGIHKRAVVHREKFIARLPKL